MANFWNRFGKRFASIGQITEASDSQADTGFAFLGANPPSVELFNAIQQQNDEKDNWLFDRIKEVMTAAGVTPSATTANQFLNSLRNLTMINMVAIKTTQAFIVPTGITKVRIQLWGGGGGGGGASGINSGGTGGGGGGYCDGTYNVAPSQSIMVTIGEGGDGGTIQNVYGAKPGGTTSFGSLASATGGDAGIGSAGAAATGNVNGGIGVGGMLNEQGGFGGYAQTYYAGGNVAAYGGGVGGHSPFGGPLAHLSISGTGHNGFFPGGGATGAGSHPAGGSWAGGKGAGGLVIVSW